MSAFLLSIFAVALAEIGDKTQLLALMLAVRFRRPRPIIAGMLCATLANHALASALGAWAGYSLAGGVLRWAVGLSFLAMAGWMLIPDKVNAGESAATRLGPFLATLVSFFLAEMGDKTQLATMALAADTGLPIAVALGSTLGLMAANLPVVLAGNAVLGVVPLRVARVAAAALFGLIGIATLLGGVGG